MDGNVMPVKRREVRKGRERRERRELSTRRRGDTEISAEKTKGIVFSAWSSASLRLCVKVFVPALLLLGALLWAQRAPSPDFLPNEVDRGAAGLSRWLHAIQTRASMLMITAHPDDEDGGMLAMETRGAGVRASLLTLTRGEGGQNAMSPDLYDALGIARTQELLAADRYYGVDQYWTPAIDFGFSKTREEATEKWGHVRLLGEVVRVIRMTRPLVVTAVFVGAPTDGHGQHQASGELAQEAYVAAGDPTRFPEQIKEGLQPWTPLKMYAHVPFFDPTPEGIYDYATDKYVPVRFYDYIQQEWSDKKPATNVEIQEGNYAPATGLTFLQIGRLGLGNQKSQNNGVALPAPAPFASAYHRYDSKVPTRDREETFFDGIDVSVAGIASGLPSPPDYLKSGLADLTRIAAEALRQYQPDRPQEIAPLLVEGLRSDRELIKLVNAHELPEKAKSNILFELRAKESQYERAVIEALGLSLQAAVMPDNPPQGRNVFGAAAPTFTMAIPGQSFNVQATLLNQGAEEIGINAVRVEASDGKSWKIKAAEELPKSIASRKQSTLKFSVVAPEDALLTRPYFTRLDEEQAYYDVVDPRYRNQSLPPYPLSAVVRASYRGVPLELSQVVQTLERIPALGVVAQPLLMGPAISVSVAPAAGAVPLGAKSFGFTCTVHSNVKGAAEGSVRLVLPEKWRSLPEAIQFAMTRDGEDRTITFEVFPLGLEPRGYEITGEAEYQGKRYREGYRLAGYPGLRPYPYYRPAVYRASAVDVKLPPELHTGYLPGTGDDIVQALGNLGQNVRVLSASDLMQGDLSGLDAIIVGVRAYAVRPELKSANHRLLEYVRGGGVEIVQYQLQDFDQNYGPYPFSLGANPQKVVDERSKVRLLKPEDAVWKWPNRITDADFGGWVEERGHGFMQTWDAKYESLVETADPDQDPQRGGLLLARYGKGLYVYDAFALYRQLPSGVPGAYRILANLVSMAKNPSLAAR